MKGINKYFMSLTDGEIQQNIHRERVGGLWEELGQLQYEFMLKQGIKPESKLLDIGCGCLRGGLFFIQYLDKGNYYGLDVNSSLLKAGMFEVERASLVDKKPNLLEDDKFSIGKFNQEFDFMVSISVFTHLPMNIIIRCLKNVKNSLAPEGKYFSTFFQVPQVAHIDDYRHLPGRVITHYDSDPFHYAAEEIKFMADVCQLDVEILGDWGHPRSQIMAVFKHPLKK